MTKRFSRLLRGCVSGAACMMAMHAQAQAISAPSEPTTTSPGHRGPVAGSGPLEEITVTARRSAEKIQSTPVSITAFNAKTLRQKSIRRTADLMFSTPGVYLSGSGGRENSVFQIRGQSKALSGTNSPAVASYFADVPQPVFGSGIDVYDMANVQVLKGPQGTLFGRNTTGGAVLFYPTLPSYKPNGYLQIGYGNYNERQVEGALTLPIVPDKIALRVSGQYEQHDGYTKNVGVGGNLDDLDVKAFRASLLLDPTPWLKNVTTLDVVSVANYSYPPGDALSALPKAAMESLGRAIAKEEGRYGIRANMVAPGIIDAGLGATFLKDLYTPEIWETQRRKVALRRFGHAEEVANAVAFLASSQSGYITGQTILVDGGFSL